MADQEEKLLLEVVFEDKATEQLVRLRTEMQKLTGPETQGSIEKLQKQTETLQGKMVPLYNSFSKTAASTLGFVRGLGPMGAAIGTLGAHAVAASANVVRLTNKLQDLGRLSMETALPAAAIKSMMDVMARAGVPPESREQIIRSVSRSMADIQRDSSELILNLRSIGRESGPVGRENMEAHIALLRKLSAENKPAAFLEEVQAAIRAVHNAVDVSPQRAAELSKVLQGLFGVDQSILKKFDGLKDTTAEQNKTMDEAVAKAMELQRAVNEVKVEVINLLNEIAKMFGGVDAATAIVKGIADVLGDVAKFLEAFGKPMAPAAERLTEEENRGGTFEGLPGLEGGTIQKQSYGGEGVGGGAFAGMLHKAAFEENTDRLVDGTRARHDLTEELRILNDFFRGQLGGLGGGSSGGGPGSTTITTPDGAQVVARPGDQLRVADAAIQIPGGATILATQQPRSESATREGRVVTTSGLPAGWSPSTGPLGAAPFGAIPSGVLPGTGGGSERLLNAIQAREGYLAPGGGSAGATGSRSWRNLSPGNLRAGTMDKVEAWGAIGKEGTLKEEAARKPGHVMFSDYWSGRLANLQRIQAVYGDKTLGEMGPKYAPPSDDPKNNPGWAKAVAEKTGVPVTKKVNDIIAPLLDEAMALPSGKPGSFQSQGISAPGSMSSSEASRNALMSGGQSAPALGGRSSPNLLSDVRKGDGGRIDLSGLDRAMGNEMNHKVEGSGKINVEVGGAKNGSADRSESLLKRTEMPRQRQMEPAREAPSRFL